MDAIIPVREIPLSEGFLDIYNYINITILGLLIFRASRFLKMGGAIDDGVYSMKIGG